MKSLIALVVVIALGGLASAQQPDKETRKKANAHFKQGKAFYDAKQWERAIGEYEAAWALIPEPLLQFNIALALQQEGDLEGALAHFANYLELDPSGAVADEAREDVVKLTPKVEQLRADREAAAKVEADRVAAEAAEAQRLREEQEREDAEAHQRELDEQAKRDAEAKRRQDEADAAARAARLAKAAPTRRRGKLMTWSGFGAVGVGAIAGGLAVVSGIQARSASDELTDHTIGPWNDPLLDEQASGRGAQTRMYVLTGVSAVAVVGGAVLVMLGRGASHRADALERVSLTPGPGHGMGLAWSF